MWELNTITWEQNTTENTMNRDGLRIQERGGLREASFNKNGKTVFSQLGGIPSGTHQDFDDFPL